MICMLVLSSFGGEVDCGFSMHTEVKLIIDSEDAIFYSILKLNGLSTGLPRHHSSC